MPIDDGRNANLLDRRLLRLQRPNRPWAIRLDAAVSDPATAADVVDAIGRLIAERPGVSAGLDASGRRWMVNTKLTLSPLSPADEPIDLAGSGLRIALADPRRLVVDVNHGFTDGLGALGVLRDLLACLVGGAASTAHRDVGDDELRGFVDRKPVGALRELTEMARHVAFRPERWPAVGTTNVAAIDITLDQVRSVCPPGTGVNDALVAAVHAGLGAHLGSERVSVSVPVDVRRLIGAPSGLGNAVLNASTRTARGRQSGSTLIRTVSGQIADQAEPKQLGARLGTYLLAARPGAPSTRSKSQVLRWPETAVCSNLGLIELPGCEQLTFAPPAHDLVAIGVTTMGETVRMSARGRAHETDLAAVLTRIASFFCSTVS